MSLPPPRWARAAKTIFTGGCLDPRAPKPLTIATNKATRPSKAPLRKTSVTNRRSTAAERRSIPMWARQIFGWVRAGRSGGPTRGRLEPSRRPDSNRGHLHYEGPALLLPSRLPPEGVLPVPEARNFGLRAASNTASGAASDPLLAALVHLLLPERDSLLERIDRVLACGEGVLAVWRGDGDHDGGLADLDAAGTVVDRDLADVVPSLQLVGDLGHDVLRHFLVCVVIEVEDRATP